MKIIKTIVITAIAVCFLSISAFAEPAAKSTPDSNPPWQSTENEKAGKEHFKAKDFKKFREEMSKDPIKALKDRKEKIQALLKDGKISQEQADKINARIDLRLKEVQEFSKLSLQQKKDKLKTDFRAFLSKKVSSGKLTQEKADTLVKEFDNRIAKWDGKGYPQYDMQWHQDNGS